MKWTPEEERELLDIHAAGDWSERHSFDSERPAAGRLRQVEAPPRSPPLPPAAAAPARPRAAAAQRSRACWRPRATRSAASRRCARASTRCVGAALSATRPAARPPPAAFLNARSPCRPPRRTAPRPAPRTPHVQVETKGYMDEQPEEEEEEDRTPKKGRSLPHGRGAAAARGTPLTTLR